MSVTSSTEKGENIVAFTWTTESLKEHFTTLFDETDRRYEERFIAQEKATKSNLDSAKEAVLKAEAAAERRFESINEFRQALSDQATQFIPRIEAVQRTEQNSEKITNLEKRMTEALTQINSRLDLNAGKSTGMNAIWGYIAGAIGIVTALVSMAVMVTR